MVARRIPLFLAAFALTVVGFGTAAWADGERGTAAEAQRYEAREGDAPGLQEFAGGVGGLLTAIVAFFSSAVQTIAEFLGFGDDEPAAPSRDQGRLAPPEPLFGPA